MPLIQSTQKILLLLALLCLSLNFLVQAQQNTITPEPRTDQGCVLLTHSPAIYCYGGQVFNPLYATDDKGVSSNSVFIKLNLTRDINVNQMQSSWEQIPSSIGSNYYFAMTAIPDTNSIFMDGGSGGGNGGINLVGRNTTIYNVEAQNPSWSTNIPTRENALVRGHQAVLGQDNNTIFVFGGIRTVDTGGLQPGDEYEFPLQMNRYLISENRWIIGDPVESLAATRYDHQVVHVGSLIYLIGGRFPNPLNVSMAFAAPMNQIPIFDTSSGQWSYPNTTGGVIPQTRSRHSVTLINENQILLFGGQYPFDSGVIRQDYFYLLNINDLSWSNTQQISEEDGISFVRESGGGIRGHSAVLVGKNLFIMFGLTISGLRTGLTNRGWILDTERMAWVASMSGISPSDAVPPNSNPTETTSASSSVSGGTIAGAVVGSVAGVALIAGVAFFLIRRKRSQQPPSPPPQETNKKYNTAGGQYGNYTSFDSPPPPNYGELEHHNIVNNRNIRQPLSPTTHYSQDYSDNTTLQSPSSASGSHAPEKPDGGVQRLVLIPAKPDGA